MRTLVGAVSGYVSDENIWLQERQYINVTSIANVSGETWRTMYVSLQDSNGSEIARYAVDSNKKVLIDLAEYLRTLAGSLGAQFSIKIAAYYSVSGIYATAQTLTFTPVGLISPERLFVPMTKDAQMLTEADLANNPNAFVFPNKIIGGAGQSVLFVYGASNVWYKWTEDGETWETGGSSVNALVAPKAITFPAGTKAVKITHQDMRADILRTFAAQECGKRYARVTWMPAFGSNAKKSAFWEMRSHTTQADPTVLQPDAAGDFYRDVRGRDDIVMLTLTGLTRFDVWYYGDISTSSDVEIDGFGRVQVMTNEVVFPDGESGTFELKIKCKLAEYDAVAL